MGAFEVQNTTAASVNVGGRVTANRSRGIANARVTLTDQYGETRTVLTNPFGYYRFADIAAGQTVIITVASKRFQFASQVVHLAEEINGLNFVAEP